MNKLSSPMYCPICGSPCGTTTVASSDGGSGSAPKITSSEGTRYLPFCSARCQRIDLGNWLGERYAVPGEPAAIDANETERDSAG